MLLKVQARLWNRRSLAVAVMTIALLIVFILPFMLAINAIVTHAGDLTERGRALITLQLPPLPPWVEKLPFVGQRIEAAWRDLLDAGGAGVAERIRPYVGAVARWFASSVGSVGALYLAFFHLCLRALGTTLSGVRTPSVIGGILSLFTAALLGRAFLPRGFPKMIVNCRVFSRWKSA